MKILDNDKITHSHIRKTTRNMNQCEVYSIK